MKNQLLTISATAILLLAGQSAIADSDDLFTLSSLDADTTYQVSDTNTAGDSDLIKASSLNYQVTSDEFFPLDSSN